MGRHPAIFRIIGQLRFIVNHYRQVPSLGNAPVCVIRVSYAVFYTVERFWRLLSGRNLCGIKPIRGFESRPRRHSSEGKNGPPPRGTHAVGADADPVHLAVEAVQLGLSASATHADDRV